MIVKMSMDGKWYVTSGNDISQDFDSREDADLAVQHDTALCVAQGLDIEASPDGAILEWE